MTFAKSSWCLTSRTMAAVSLAATSKASAESGFVQILKQFEYPHILLYSFLHLKGNIEEAEEDHQ